MTKRLKSFSVTVPVQVLCEVQIKATSWEVAARKARYLAENSLGVNYLAYKEHSHVKPSVYWEKITEAEVEELEE